MTAVSVIIPTLNEEHYIQPLLESLHHQTVLPKEVLVVDGRSKDRTTQLVKKYPDIKLFSVNPQVAAQRNYGTSKATGEILLFLDADTRLPPDFIQKVKIIFKNPQLDLACPWFIPDTKNPFIIGIYLFFSIQFWLLQKIIPSGAGMCLIIKRNSFLKSAGFDPQYKFDDIELIRRLSKHNHYGIVPLKVWVSPRRFYKQGVLLTFFQYLLLAFFFCTNQFKMANKVPYLFGNYKK